MSDQYYESPLHPGRNGSSGKDGLHYSGRERYQGEINPAEADHDDEIDLKHLLGTVLRYKWAVLFITITVTVLAGVYAFSLLPVYESEGTLLISDNQSRYSLGGSDISNLLTTTYGIGVGSQLTNEIQVFQSRSLARAVTNKIFAQDSTGSGERFPILWASYPEDSSLATRDSVSVRLREAMTVERIDNETDVLRISFRSFSPHEATWLVDTTIDTYLELSAEQNRMSANSALEFLEGEREQVQNELQQSEEALRAYMDQTDLVEVDGQTSAAITRLAELESQRQQLQVQRVSVSSSIQAYQGQLDEIRPGLAEQFSENIGSTLERAQFRLAELETERLLLLQRNPHLRSNPDSEPYFVELNERIQLTKQEIDELAANLIGDESNVSLGFLNSGEGGVAGQVMELRSRLIELEIEESQIQAQEEVLDRRISEENEFLEGLPSNMLELARLRRNAEVNEQIYLTISNQYAETSLWEQTQFGSGRPIDYGYLPDEPVEPRKKMYALVGFLLGGLLSVGYAFGREAMNRTIDGTEKVRKAGYPLLAVIPDLRKSIQERFSGKDFIHVEERKISTSWSTLIDSVSPIAEGYRRLHNNVIYSNPDEKFQTILVTSSTKGEGKSTITINLAVALAEAGKKVLIVDTDLRRPNIHTLTGESRDPGIVEVLYDSKPISVAVKPSIAPGIHIMTSGRSIPNPSAVMQSSKLRELLYGLKEKYDHIVIDTPPYGIITDAAPLMKMADGVVLVCRFGLTQTNQLNHTVENLKRIQANVIGTVITNYRHKESADYYYSNEYTYDSYEAYEEYQEET